MACCPDTDSPELRSVWQHLARSGILAALSKVMWVPKEQIQSSNRQSAASTHPFLHYCIAHVCLGGWGGVERWQAGVLSW